EGTPAVQVDSVVGLLICSISALAKAINKEAVTVKEEVNFMADLMWDVVGKDEVVHRHNFPEGQAESTVIWFSIAKVIESKYKVNPADATVFAPRNGRLTSISRARSTSTISM
ncbi:hypothetical protein BGZ83_003991, partial [Gryganskiella cystojenkinii]